MRSPRPLLLTVLVSLSLLACGGAPEPVAPKPAEVAPPPPVATSEAPKPSADAPKDDAATDVAAAPKALEPIGPTVKLLEAGAAPRKALRYKFKAGVTEYVEMDMKMSMAMTMGAKTAPKMDLPTVRTTMRVEAKEVTPEGDVRCTFSADRVDILKDGLPDPKLRAGLEKEMAALVGVHGKVRFSARGVASETELELPPGAPATLKNQLDSMRDSVRQMSVPFPEEEVGKGAKWEVNARVPVSGAMMDTKMLFTLAKVDASTAQTDVETTITAPPNQVMSVPALPPGASATLDSLTGTGTGKVSPAFTHLVGTSTNKLTMETAFGVAMQGEKIQMKMQSDVIISLHAGKAPPAAAPAKK